MHYDFHDKRLFVRDDLSSGAVIEADRGQTHYLVNVLRKGAGDGILLFNGRDGEWSATVEPRPRKVCLLTAETQVRAQTPPSDLHYLFAPLKHARLDYLVQKAVEMGAGRLRPVLTQFTQTTRVNRTRMEANVVEAAEQCGVLSIPEVEDPKSLLHMLAEWNPERRLVVCDEAAPVASPAEALREARPGPAALLVGPEGGFSEGERHELLKRPYVLPISLGPRVIRADTAAVAALALVQTFIGDWR